MDKDELTKLDIAKLHNEINILVNVRILLAIAAASTAGFGFISSQSIAATGNKPLILQFAWLAITFSVVIAIQYTALGVWTKIRFYAGYLRAREYSGWEIDFHNFRFVTTGNTHRETSKLIASIDSVSFSATYIAIAVLGTLIFIYKLYTHILPQNAIEIKIALLSLMIIIEISSMWYLHRTQRIRSTEGFEKLIEDAWRSIIATPPPTPPPTPKSPQDGHTENAKGEAAAGVATKADLEGLKTDIAKLDGKIDKLGMQVKLLIVLTLIAIALFSPNLAALVKLAK